MDAAIDSPPGPSSGPVGEPPPGSPGEPKLVGVLRIIDNAVGRLEQALLAVLLIVLVGVGATQAVATQFGTSWLWSFEIIRYAVFFIAMTGAALSAQAERLLSMDIIPRLIPQRPRAWLKVVVRVFTLAMCVALIVGGKALSDSAAEETMYHVIEPRLGLLALPIGAALIGFHMLLHNISDLAYLLRGIVPPSREEGPPLH